MGAKIDYIKEAGTDWKVLPRCFIVFGLENDQKRNGFRPGRCPLQPLAPDLRRHAVLGHTIEIIELRHQLPAADGAIRRIKRHGHVPWAGIA
jgi:hypothetical protein